MRARAVAACAVVLVALGMATLAVLGTPGTPGADAGTDERESSSPEGEGDAAPSGGWLPEGAELATRSSELSLEEEGSRVLERYRARGDCVLAQAGYLDLTGRVWGCVVQGDGWVEVCLVEEGDDGGGCSVSVVRMDAADASGLVEGS